MNRLTDEELVALCLSGQKDAFGELVARYQRVVYKIAYSLAGDPDDAADWSQDSFVKIYRSLPSFDASKGKFFSWLYRIAHNVCINQLAKRDGARPKGETSLEESFDEAADSRIRNVSVESIAEPETPEYDASCNPHAALEAAELREELHRALGRLDEKYSLPIILQYIEGLSYQEIAERTGLPQSTIETRLFRGKKMLQQQLAHLRRQ